MFQCDALWDPCSLTRDQTRAPCIGSLGVFTTRPSGKSHFDWLLGFPGGSDGKESALQETRIQSLGQEDPLEKGMATHS